MACSGNVSFTLIGSQYVAVTTGGTLLVVECVGNGATGWRLTSTVGITSRSYSADSSSTCTPISLVFLNVIIDCGTVNISLSANMGPCATSSTTPAGSSVSSQGGGGGGGISRVSLGADTSVIAVTSYTIPSITVEDGLLILLVCGAANDAGSGATATWNGLPMFQDGIFGGLADGNGVFLRSTRLSIPVTAGTHDIEISSSLAVQLYAIVLVKGLASDAQDQQTNGANNVGTPTSGTSPTTSTPDEYVQGFVAYTDGSAGTWTNGFTDGGQSATVAFGGSVVTITEGYRILSVTTTYDVALTMGVDPGVWNALGGSYY